ncbi:MAG: hypothetical protein HW414_1167 [Dehalococcoidia bacterium]|nr:hypothetical protein [Dehalococcoidia bacterium]
MKRIGTILVVLIMTGLLLAACASPKAPAPTPAPSPERPSATTPGTQSAPTSAQSREQKLVAAAKAAGEKEVVMWTFSWYAGPVEKAFQERYPFLKLTVWDGSSETEPRVIEEYKAGKYSPDVIELAIRRMTRVNAAGVLQEYAFPNWPNTWPNQPKHNFWRNHMINFYAPAYNTSLVSSAEVPKSWDELADVKWRGRAITTISGAEHIIGYAYMRGDLTSEGVKWDATVAFWKKVIEATRPRIGSGFKSPLDMAILGDVSLMLHASNTIVFNMMRVGAPLAYAPVKWAPAGGFSIGLAKHPRNPNAAQLLLDFLTSEEGNVIRSNTFPTPSLHPEGSKRALGNLMLKPVGIEMVAVPDELVTEEMQIRADEIWVRDILGRR